jgi:hypothetical protein
MRWHRWFRNEVGQSRPRRVSRERPPGRGRLRPRLEQFEDRTLLASYSAATVSDLITDIKAANKAGGSNTITLTAPTTSPYVLTEAGKSADGPTGLPIIKAGNTLTVVGNGDTIERSTASGMPDFRLFDVAIGASLTLENMTLQNGLAFGSGSSAEGGAIYNQGALILSVVAVQGNTAQGSNGADVVKGQGNPGSDAAGGGIWSNGTLTLESSTVVQNNLAVGGAGGFEFFPNPTGTTGGNGYGGGLFVAGGTVTISNTTFASNKAQGGTGGSVALGGSAGTGGTANGGGLYVGAGTVTLTGDTLENNTAQGGLGGRGSPVSDPGDGGNGFGGGLDVAAGTLILSSVLLEYNTAQGGRGDGLQGGGNGYGGGIDAAGGSVTLCSDTLEYNTATGGPSNYRPGQGFGGGTFIASGTTVYIDSSTVANTINNTDTSGLNGSTANIDGSYILQGC